MSLTFTRALEAQPGQPITSDQACSFARAWNDRILSGVGDIAWRTVVWWLNLFRLVRNPDADFNLWPALHEFFNIYQHIDPEHGDGMQWPVQGPGDPEGANLANPLMQFVFGNEVTDTEHGRLSDFTDNPGTLEGHWELAKAQRGAYDPDTGALASPAFTKAQSIYAFAFPAHYAHHKSYGGFFPTPTELLADCSGGDTSSKWYKVPSYAIKFTRLSSTVSAAGLHGTLVGDVLTYPGTCPCGSALHGQYHVAWIQEYPLAYHVWVAPDAGDCDYILDVLPVSDWIPGPYTGNPHIWRPDGGQIKRAVAAYAQDFRGTAAQRRQHDLMGQAGAQSMQSDRYRIRQLAVDNETLGTRQYPLAPALGRQNGDTVAADYLRATVRSDVRGGEPIPFDTGSLNHLVHAGFVYAGWFAKAEALADPVTLHLYSDGTECGSLTLTPDSAGAAEALEYRLTNPPAGLLTIQVAPGYGIRFKSAAGRVTIELAEVLSYKPALHDAYLVTRLMSTHGSLDTTAPVDGRGIDQTDAAGYVTRFHRYGTVHNTLGGLSIRMPGNAVNDNGVFDAARRFSRDMARIWRREHFVSYEVAGGVSILRMRRFSFGMHNIRADAFHNIAPPIDPVASGDLESGVQYIVRGPAGSWVHHGGTAYLPDAVFTANRSDFVETGGAQVFVREGIRQAASRTNWSNRWCMFLDAHCYHPSASSIWKPDAYSDFFPLIQRCLFYGGRVPDGEFARHISYSPQFGSDTLPAWLPPAWQALLIAPEAPTGYRYAQGSNQSGPYGEPTADFCKSCQVYQAPYEITSCIVESEWDGDQVLKLTLDRRFDSHTDAPATVNPDPGTWDAAARAALAAEGHRTDDNALREYALDQHDGTRASFKTGDCGVMSTVSGLSDNPYGAVYPTLCAVHLLPEPWVDANNKADPADTRLTVPMTMAAEVLTRAGCEGFVDERTTLDLQCDGTESNLFDYTFENLCFDAFGGRWIGPFKTTERPDNPEGFGPLANTSPRAEVYNRLVSAVNKLTRARIDFALTFEARQLDDYTSHPAQNMAGEDCSLTSAMGAWSEPARWLGAANYATGAWGTESGIQASRVMFLAGCPFTLECHEVRWQYRVAVDATLRNALPDAVAELVDLGAVGCMVRRTALHTDYRREDCDPGDAESCGGSLVWGNQRWVDRGATATDCIFVTAGTLTAESPPEQSIYFGTGPGPVQCQLSTGSYLQLDIASGTEFFVEVPTVEFVR